MDNLKQEEPSKDTDSLYQPIQSEYKCENIVIVSDHAQSTNISIKQECNEEDPLNIPDELDLTQEVQSKQIIRKLNTKIAKVYMVRCTKILNTITIVTSVTKALLNRIIWTHIQSIHENVCYNCDICGKDFSVKRNLNRHIKNVHGNSVIKAFLSREHWPSISKVYMRIFDTIRKEHQNTPSLQMLQIENLKVGKS